MTQATVRIGGPTVRRDPLQLRLEPAEASAPLPHAPGFEILEVLGRGAVGVVCRARQLSLGREVALKMLHPALAMESEQLARIRAEAEIVARLRHPHIVRIHEVGQHAGQPFLVFEYLEGGTLEDHQRGQPLDPRRAAELLAKVADAVGAAHEAGIVHRDLKPANLLLDRAGEPKVVDFGLAFRANEGARLTADGTVMGTPAYMSPEQALGKAEAIGPATDVYALGAILYELLTGRPPFLGGDSLATLSLLLANEPVPPRRLQPSVPKDLETICLKCLDKQAVRRYPTARELAVDLRRWLAGETILARRAGLLERAAKWAQRRPAVSALSAALALLAAGSAGAVVALWNRAEDRAAVAARARETAEHATRQMAARTANANYRQAVALADADNVRMALPRMADALAMAEAAGDASLADDIRRSLAAWSEAPRWQSERVFGDWVTAIAFSPDGALVASGGVERLAMVWNPRTGEHVGEPLTFSAGVADLAFAARGKLLLALVSPDQQESTLPAIAPAGPAALHFWDVELGKPARAPQVLPGTALALRVHPSGTQVAALLRQGVRIFRLPDGAPAGAFDFPEPDRAAADLSFHPDGRSFALASHVLVDPGMAKRGHGGRVALHGFPSLEPLGPRAEYPGIVAAATFGADGGLWTAAGNDWAVRRLDGRTLAALAPPMPHRGRILGLRVRGDGLAAAAGGLVRGLDPATGKPKKLGGEARVWGADGKPLTPPLPHPNTVWALAFGANGKTLYTGCEDAVPRVWSLESGALLQRMPAHQGTVSRVEAAPGGEWIAWADLCTHGRCRVHRAGTHFHGDGVANPKSGPLAALAHAGGRFVAVAESGECFALGGAAGLTDTPLKPFVLSGAGGVGLRARTHESALGALEFESLALADGAALGRWRFDEPDRVFHAACFTHDGRWALVGLTHARRDRPQFRHAFERIDPRAGTRLALPCAGAAAELVSDVALHPAGWRFATRDLRTHGVREWDGRTGALLPAPPRHSGFAAMQYDPQGERLLTDGAARHTLQAWRTPTGEPDGEPLQLPAAPHGLAFSRDGRFLLVGADDEAAYLWSWPGRRRIGPRLHCAAAAGQPHPHSIVRHLAWSADGRQLAFGAGAAHVAVRDLPAPLPGTSDDIRRRIAWETGLAPADPRAAP